MLTVDRSAKPFSPVALAEAMQATARAAQAIGIRYVKRVPSGVELASSVPPCAFAISAHMYKPRPSPC